MLVGIYSRLPAKYYISRHVDPFVGGARGSRRVAEETFHNVLNLRL